MNRSSTSVSLPKQAGIPAADDGARDRSNRRGPLSAETALNTVSAHRGNQCRPRCAGPGRPLVENSPLAVGSQARATLATPTKGSSEPAHLKATHVCAFLLAARRSRSGLEPVTAPAASTPPGIDFDRLQATWVAITALTQRAGWQSQVRPSAPAQQDADHQTDCPGQRQGDKGLLAHQCRTLISCPTPLFRKTLACPSCRIGNRCAHPGSSFAGLFRNPVDCLSGTACCVSVVPLRT